MAEKRREIREKAPYFSDSSPEQFFSCLRNQSQNDGAIRAKLKPLWDIFSAI